ncbi:hypothetical protein GCM10007423_12080 [Dyadobacter endophyticus]|uniref:SMODS and SLOG-associating 2TM effector domain-containing protein n=1 Tax=Dyadobacter endophyticus TaxID=1749036 RepID=A0ABQ1YJV1_9BACT|nr:hypothetical protein [Dyadobacter endophyticus]GGH26806.1 hypothetical protein GCM10007423_12080 [Dyadobacter endophyticus]
MSSESISKQTLARIKAEYLARYEIEMDDWSAIILLDNQAQFQNMDSQLRAVLDENKKLSGKIKDSVKTIQFNSIWEAFIHGLGKGLPYSITALVLGILYYVYMSTYVDYQRIEDFVSAYENAPDYVALIREGETETSGGIKYLILSPSKRGKYAFGKSYEFDSRRKLVKVPLQRKN